MGSINERFIGQAWEKMTVLQLALGTLQLGTPGIALSETGKQAGEHSEVQEQV